MDLTLLTIPETEVESFIRMIELINKTNSLLFKTSSGYSEDQAEIQKNRQILRITIEEKRQLIGSLSRFGLTAPMLPSGDLTNQTRQWINWWVGYLKHISNEEMQTLRETIKNKGDLSRWYPKTPREQTKAYDTLDNVENCQ